MDDFKTEINNIADKFYSEFKGNGTGSVSALNMSEKIKREQDVLIKFSEIFKNKVKEHFGDDFNQDELQDFFNTVAKELVIKCHNKA